MKVAYVHIPFCKSKCLYCDFNSFDNKNDLIEEYIEALIKEINSYNVTELDTIYIGGGTPSFIDEKHISRILANLPMANEITIEMNPGTITYEKLIEYKKAGVNRVSMGLQVADNTILKKIGRIHTLEEFEISYDLVRKAGFENVNVDLMFGLPTQTLDNFKESVEYLLKLNPEHISSYSLILHNDIFKDLPSDEEERKMYHYLVERMQAAGYKHYEISNFAKTGFESKHNLAYWKQVEYYGFGAGASSYLDEKRYTNVSDIRKYINQVNEGKDVKILEEVQNFESKLNEYMMLGLRIIDGVNIQEVNEKFKVDVLEIYKERLEKLENMGLIKIDENIALTKKGLDLANIVWEEFV